MLLTNSGIPYLELNSSKEEVDNILIGGYSSALSTVWSNFVESDEPGIEIIERNEDKICMVVHRTNSSAMLLLSDKRPSDRVLAKITKIHNEIEKEFSEIVEFNNQGVYKELPTEPVLRMFRNYYLGL